MARKSATQRLIDELCVENGRLQDKIILNNEMITKLKLSIPTKKTKATTTRKRREPVEALPLDT